MIQIEEVQQRRKEIAEIRHADSVYRDIVARENEREDYEKRWFWELLQNAKDSINENESIKVKIEISENQISLSHTGNPFELDDILSLILQGSSKNNKEGKTGRFGTGFMTTYLLSKEVYITGKLTNNQGCFHFLLDRNAEDNDNFYDLQQKSNKDFEESITENSYLGNDEFQTKFTYNLDENGKITAKIGLDCLDELIPITQLFNEQIESVIVIENGNIKTFSKLYIQTHKSGVINEWEINTVVNDIKHTSLRAYIQKDEKFDSCIITYLLNQTETVFPLTNNYPRLYFTFPLIGTEEIGVPIIINSTLFEPRVERDGIYLKKNSEGENESINKDIISKALLNSLPLFAELFKEKDIKGIYELFDFKLSKDLKWIDHEWFTQIKHESVLVLSSKKIIAYNESNDNYTCLSDLTIPYSIKQEDIKELWEIFANVNTIKVPIIDELLSWVKIVERISDIKPEKDIYKLNFIWGISELIDFVQKYDSLEELEKSIKIDSTYWLNKFYSIIIKVRGIFPLEKKIALNQRKLLRKAEGMSWDKCNDDTLISISDLIELNFADKLISREINSFQISSIGNFTLQDAENELKSSLNALSESSFNNIDFQICNAKFLKWLISNEQKEIIRDLKVLTGVSKKSDESFIYDYFPKTEHLLLTPKGFFQEEFPLFANLVRDKDCLNEIYHQYLSTDDNEYLNNNGFIHLKPLVTKTEIASIKLLEYLIINENDLSLLRDNEGHLKYKFKITYTDFAYLTATDGHIYGRNATQKSSFERFKFLLTEAVDKDSAFEIDKQEVKIEELGYSFFLKQCLWVYRAKKLNWINVKTESDNSETKFISETPSSKNLSNLLKEEESLVKAIRGSKQQLLLSKLSVGVSDLIRNTIEDDEVRLNWDKAITNMIISDIDPKLVQEIFSDPNIKKEYEKRLNERRLINRNQSIGNLIEVLFKDYINHLKKNGFSINIYREPLGSDYIITDESSDLVNINNEREGFKINNWLIELKATGKNYAAMSPLQAKTATEKKDNYALIVVPLDGSEPDIEYLKQNAKVISNIGYKIENVFTDFSEIELKKSNLNNGKDGISVNIEAENVRFRVSSTVWNTEQMSIEAIIKNIFARENTVSEEIIS